MSRSGDPQELFILLTVSSGSARPPLCAPRALHRRSALESAPFRRQLLPLLGRPQRPGTLTRHRKRPPAPRCGDALLQKASAGLVRGHFSTAVPTFPLLREGTGTFWSRVGAFRRRRVCHAREQPGACGSSPVPAGAGFEGNLSRVF